MAWWKKEQVEKAVYDAAVMAQTAHALQVFGASKDFPSLAQVQGVVSVLGEASAIVLSMAIHASEAAKRGLVPMADANVQAAIHSLQMLALDGQVMDVALHNTRPDPALPIAERIIDAIRQVMAVTAGTGYQVTPEAALVPISAMPQQPMHVVVDKG